MTFSVSVAPDVAPGLPATAPSAAQHFVQNRIEAVRALLGEREILAATLAAMNALAPDEQNKPALLQYLRDGIARNDRRYELRSALRALARGLQPRTYLEIGTRRGWSMAQVAGEVEDVRVWSVDLWVPDYAGVPNPGPEFVHAEVCRASPAFRGRVTYVDGNSHDLLPVLLDGWRDPEAWPEELELVRESEGCPRGFDLVTVDGDHTAVGAYWDLVDVMPRIALGGAVVFDDLVDRSDELLGDRARCRLRTREAAPADLRPSLLDVWRRLPARFPNFEYLENLDASPPIGIAFRRR